MIQTVSTKLDISSYENWSDASRFEDLYKILGFGLLRVKSTPQIGTVMVLDHNTINPNQWERVIERVRKDYRNVKEPEHIKLQLTLLSIEQRIFSSFSPAGYDDELELEDTLKLVFKMDIIYAEAGVQDGYYF